MDVPGFAVITGAASGIGRACARAFFEEGSAGMALLDINLADLGSLRDELLHSHEDSRRRNGSHGDAKAACKIEIHQVNVTDEHRVNAVINAIAQSFGRIDYLVNAAGIAVKHAGGVAYAETSDWKRTMDVNLNGSFFILRATAEAMLSQECIRSSIDGRPIQRGSIVNFSSIQGISGIPMSASYAATKGAILALTRSASEDYAKDGIRINAICPGYTETPLTTKNPQVLAAMKEKVATAVPMQRMGNAAEIADGVLYLAGGRSSFVTGTGLVVDGGYTSR